MVKALFTKRTMRAVGDPDLEQGLGGGSYFVVVVVVSLPSFSFLHDFFFHFLPKIKGARPLP